MAAHPDRVSVGWTVWRFPVDVRGLHGDDRAATWDLITREVPRFTRSTRRRTASSRWSGCGAAADRRAAA